MVSRIWKYEANPKSPFLEDKGYIPDPDFWSNQTSDGPLPIWSICGPRIRPGLEKGDRVFFAPMPTSFEQAYESYFSKEYEIVCTGILTVEEKKDYDSFVSSEELNNEFLNAYRQELLEHKHLVNDIQDGNCDTAKNRLENIVLGNPNQSIWFGDNNLHLKEALEEADLDNMIDSLSKRRIEGLSRQESNRLYDVLTEKLDPRAGCPYSVINQ